MIDFWISNIKKWKIYKCKNYVASSIGSICFDKVWHLFYIDQTNVKNGYNCSLFMGKK